VTPVEIGQWEYMELLYSLKDGKETKTAHGSAWVGSHRTCGGKCTIITRYGAGDPRRFVIKPHTKCDPVECIGINRCECSGRSRPLPKCMLSSSKAA
jgi:hypothetical protein